VHTHTRTFWVKLWHAASSEMTRIERAQVISCLPSTRGVQIVVDDYEETDDDELDEETAEDSFTNSEE
jgi:hypothetical protein